VEVAKIERKSWAERALGQQEIKAENSLVEPYVETLKQQSLEIKIIKIFLASSSELKDDRAEFERLIGRENKEYIKSGIFLELNMWEDFLDTLSETSLQDEYNKEVQESDIFISLFHTKVGKYTEEEFQKALQTFKTNGKPLIYTYFKNESIAPIEITDDIQTLLSFRKKLRDLGHFCTMYENIDDLKYQFSNQIEKIIPNFSANISPLIPKIDNSSVEQENSVNTMAKPEHSSEKNSSYEINTENQLKNEVIKKQSLLEVQQQAISRHINKNNFFMLMKTVKSLAPIIGGAVQMLASNSSGGYNMELGLNDNLGNDWSEILPQQEG
jgi:hypothetical protein